MKITATIITLNEERNIARAIESLRCCDEILIVDSGSVDRTVELAEKLGARMIEAGWLGFGFLHSINRAALYKVAAVKSTELPVGRDAPRGRSCHHR